MNLDTLHETVGQSKVGDWHQLEYSDFFRHVAYYGDDSYRSQHSSRAVLRSDLSISIEWGLPTREAEHEDGHLWARERGFPDPHIHSFWIDVFVADSLVDRVRAYDVDGGRAYLPQYRQYQATGQHEEGMPQGSWHFTVAEWPFVLTRLVNHLDSHHEFDSYLRQVGFEVASS